MEKSATSPPFQQRDPPRAIASPTFSRAPMHSSTLLIACDQEVGDLRHGGNRPPGGSGVRYVMVMKDEEVNNYRQWCRKCSKLTWFDLIWLEYCKCCLWPYGLCDASAWVHDFEVSCGCQGAEPSHLPNGDPKTVWICNTAGLCIVSLVESIHSQRRKFGNHWNSLPIPTQPPAPRTREIPHHRPSSSFHREWHLASSRRSWDVDIIVLPCYDAEIQQKTLHYQSIIIPWTSALCPHKPVKHLRATKVLLIIRSLWPSQPSHDTQPLNDLAQITMHNSHQTLFNGKKFPGKHHETKVTHKSIQKFEVPQVDMEANQWKWDFLGVFFSPPKSCQNWLVVSTHLKNTSQNGNFPQIGVLKKIFETTT